MGVNYSKLVEHYKAEPDAAHKALRESIKAREVRAADFDLGRLFEEVFGWHEFASCRKDNKRLVSKDVYEAAGAVASNLFANITGQIVYSAILDSYEAPQFVFKNLIPVVPTEFMDGEKIAGITGIGDELGNPVAENENFPLFGVSEDWIETPKLRKYGGIVPVTREALFKDRTGVLLDRCSKIGYWLGYSDELRAIDCVVDENGGAASIVSGGHRYHRRGNSVATYGNNSGNHDFDNLEGSNQLLDYSDIEKAELLLDAMTDPGTGVITGEYRMSAIHLVVSTSELHTAKQILSATEIRLHAAGYATSGNLYDRLSPNSLQNYQIVTSPLLAARKNTDTDWHLGNISKAFRKMQAWPLETTQAPANSHEEFTRDIVQQYKAEQCDAYATFDPRFIIKSTVA